MDKDSPLARILIIDDDDAVLDFMSCLLSRAGFHIDTVLNGEEGLRRVENHPYDLIITDYRMPGLTGAQILKQIREQKGNELPVICISGASFIPDKDRFDAVIAKPVTHDELLAVIHKVCRFG